MSERIINEMLTTDLPFPFYVLINYCTRLCINFIKRKNKTIFEHIGKQGVIFLDMINNSSLKLRVNTISK